MKDELRQTKSMPVCLLMTGRPCAVVGGGAVAVRKIGHLLEAGAQVTLISPELCTAAAEMVSSGRVRHVFRPFECSDVDGMMLVFAATNDRRVNRRVLEACRERKILCSCVDGNWVGSDFTTPAISRQGNVMLTVSTGGHSCRQAKLIRDNLAKHIAMVETADLVVVGTDHRHMDLEEREPFHLTGERYERAGWMLMQLWGLHEFMILNTCNRIEVMAVASRETGTNGILRYILGFDRLHEDQFYLKHGVEAYEHLCLVSSGMLSQMPGESHISAQVKAALADAQQRGWAGSLMQEWVSSLLHVSKHIQTDAAPLLRTEEIEDLALHVLQTGVPDLSQKTLMVLGAGTVGEGLVRAAVAKVGKVIWCCHINRPALSDEWEGRVELITLNGMKERLGEADIIVSATDAPGYILHSGHAPFFDQGKPVLLVDLGVPRNMDPALAGLSPEIRLIDLDGLKYTFRKENPLLDSVLTRCGVIIGEHRKEYERMIERFQGGNTKEQENPAE
jgi:glutamyl-tRNA reductase